MFGRFWQPNAQPRNGRRSGRVRLNVEALEQRWVPIAGVNLLNVTQDASGVVHVAEAAGSKDTEEAILITQVNATTYALAPGAASDSFSGNNATELVLPANAGSNFTPTSGTISNGSAVTISNVTGFNIQLGGVADSATEADVVKLLGDGSAGTQLSGNLVINATPALSGDQANLDVQEKSGTNFNVAGQLGVTVGGKGGILAMGLTQDDTYGSVLIQASDGGTVLPTVGGSSTFTADNNIRISGGTTGVEIYGYLSANFTGGSNEVSLGSFGGTAVLKIDDYLSYISTAKGNNNLEAGTVTVGSNVAMQSSGVSTLNLTDSTVVNGNVTTTDAGTDVFALGDSASVTGNVSLNTSGSTSGMTVDVFATKIGGYLSAISTGSGGASYIIDDASIGSNFGFNAGTGSVGLNISGTPPAGATAVIGGNLFQVASNVGGESVNITGSGTAQAVGGYVSLNAPGATGNVSVTVDGSGAGTDTLPTVGGYLSVISGKGSDSVHVTNAAFIGSSFAWNTGAGDSSITIDGGAEVFGDAYENPGASTVTTGITGETFTITTGGYVDGFVSVNSPNAIGTVSVTVNGDVSLTEDAIGGYLSVISGKGSDSVLIGNGAVIGGAFAFLLGDGNNTVHTDAATINGPMFGVFGSGNDKLLLEGPSDNGTTTLGSFLSVVMGDGNDSVQLGNNANSLVFTSTLYNATIDGGGGTNTLNQHLSGGQPTSVQYAFAGQLQATNFQVNL